MPAADKISRGHEATDKRHSFPPSHNYSGSSNGSLAVYNVHGRLGSTRIQPGLELRDCLPRSLTAGNMLIPWKPGLTPNRIRKTRTYGITDSCDVDVVGQISVAHHDLHERLWVILGTTLYYLPRRLKTGICKISAIIMVAGEVPYL